MGKRFYAKVVGDRDGMVTRGGSIESGITVAVNGWDVGVRVAGRVSRNTNQDVFEIYATGGSHNEGKQQLLVTVTKTESGDVVVNAAGVPLLLRQGLKVLP